MHSDRTYSITDEQYASFERDGFLGPLPAFASSEVLDAVRGRFEDTVTRREPHPLYGRFSVRDWHLVHRQVCDLFQHSAIVERVQQLLGQDITLWRTKVFYKEPCAGEIGWHQEWGWFNGEEIGNDRPALAPSRVAELWNLTVWVALDDITPDNGALRFVRGSHITRYPIAMVPISDSAFFQDPFLDQPTASQVIERAEQNKLVLDVETSHIFDDVDPSVMTREQLMVHVMRRLRETRAAITLPFDVEPDRVVPLYMRKGQFVIFSERTMHGSLPNNSKSSRIAINARVTRSDTLVYPGRLRGEFVDGSNLNIRRHRCVQLSGAYRHPFNEYAVAEDTMSNEAGLRELQAGHVRCRP